MDGGPTTDTLAAGPTTTTSAMAADACAYTDTPVAVSVDTLKHVPDGANMTEHGDGDPSTTLPLTTPPVPAATPASLKAASLSTNLHHGLAAPAEHGDDQDDDDHLMHALQLQLSESLVLDLPPAASDDATDASAVSGGSGGFAATSSGGGFRMSMLRHDHHHDQVHETTIVHYGHQHLDIAEATAADHAEWAAFRQEQQQHRRSVTSEAHHSESSSSANLHHAYHHQLTGNSTSSSQLHQPQLSPSSSAFRPSASLHHQRASTAAVQFMHTSRGSSTSPTGSPTSSSAQLPGHHNLYNAFAPTSHSSRTSPNASSATLGAAYRTQHHHFSPSQQMQHQQHQQPWADIASAPATPFLDARARRLAQLLNDYSTSAGASTASANGTTLGAGGMMTPLGGTSPPGHAFHHHQYDDVFGTSSGTSAAGRHLTSGGASHSRSRTLNTPPTSVHMSPYPAGYAGSPEVLATAAAAAGGFGGRVRADSLTSPIGSPPGSAYLTGGSNAAGASSGFRSPRGGASEGMAGRMLGQHHQGSMASMSMPTSPSLAAVQLAGMPGASGGSGSASSTSSSSSSSAAHLFASRRPASRGTGLVFEDLDSAYPTASPTSASAPQVPGSPGYMLGHVPEEPEFDHGAAAAAASAELRMNDEEKSAVLAATMLEESARRKVLVERAGAVAGLSEEDAANLLQLRERLSYRNQHDPTYPASTRRVAQAAAVSMFEQSQQQQQQQLQQYAQCGGGGGTSAMATPPMSSSTNTSPKRLSPRTTGMTINTDLANRALGLVAPVTNEVGTNTAGTPGSAAAAHHYVGSPMGSAHYHGQHLGGPPSSSAASYQDLHHAGGSPMHHHYELTPEMYAAASGTPFSQHGPVTLTTPTVVVEMNQAPKHIYVSELPPIVDEMLLRKAFRRFGRIDDIRLSKTKMTGTLNGVAYVKFSFSDSVTKALEADGDLVIGGKRIKVAATDPTENPTKKLFFANVWDLTQEDLLPVCKQFGEVTQVDVVADRGMMYVHFVQLDEAVRAHRALQGLTINNRYVRVEFGQSTANYEMAGGGHHHHHHGHHHHAHRGGGGGYHQHQHGAYHQQHQHMHPGMGHPGMYQRGPHGHHPYAPPHMMPHAGSPRSPAHHMYGMPSPLPFVTSPLAPPPHMHPGMLGGPGAGMRKDFYEPQSPMGGGPGRSASAAYPGSGAWADTDAHSAAGTPSSLGTPTGIPPGFAAAMTGNEGMRRGSDLSFGGASPSSPLPPHLMQAMQPAAYMYAGSGYAGSPAGMAMAAAAAGSGAYDQQQQAYHQQRPGSALSQQQEDAYRAMQQFEHQEREERERERQASAGLDSQ
ncbi:hypothetical protein BCR44DRAFT_347444 [Catenaria anguillulae PL171]|uniref:RRM domain-containing protein n=1 Tax=Catenaria anguillulae PL171 TaxID=765915 RepID=A0A1Y2H747_9FUNG|nr:hypothetical protein BCR44DRAFT_347444 [Catenaria anguillulae PL171]